MLQPAVLGGLFIGVLSALPIVNLANCCCLWVIGGGALAAYLDIQTAPRPYTAARGAQIGLLAGVVGAFIYLVVRVPVDSLMAPLEQALVNDVLTNADDLPPQVRGWLEMVNTQQTGALAYAFDFVFRLLSGAIFATLGGVLATVLFRKDGAPPALGGDATVPPPLPPTE